jgi:hypothetical protein
MREKTEKELYKKFLPEFILRPVSREDKDGKKLHLKGSLEPSS